MNTGKKVLVVLTQAEKETFFPPSLWQQLLQLLPDSEYVDSETLSEATWRDLLRRVQPDVLMAAWKTPTLPADIDAVTGGKLKYVCYLAGSVRKLVSEQMVHDGMLVTNWGNSVSRTIAECGLMMAIACLRRAHQWALDMHLNSGWKDASLVSCSLFERRVGMHGYGAIAQELRKLLVPFDVPVMTYSPSVPDELLREHDVQRCDSLDRLFSENDVIIELAALTPKSVHMVREEHLRLIPSGGVFVNIGRGAVVDEDALLRVAQTSDLQIALDVFETEPLAADSPFRGQRNIMLLPHLGGPTLDRRQDSGRFALQNLRAFMNGEPLQGQITSEVYARTT